MQKCAINFMQTFNMQVNWQGIIQEGKNMLSK